MIRDQAPAGTSSLTRPSTFSLQAQPSIATGPECPGSNWPRKTVRFKYSSMSGLLATFEHLTGRVNVSRDI